MNKEGSLPTPSVEQQSFDAGDITPGYHGYPKRRGSEVQRIDSNSFQRQKSIKSNGIGESNYNMRSGAGLKLSKVEEESESDILGKQKHMFSSSDFEDVLSNWWKESDT